MKQKEIGYLALLRTNPSFRRLWFASIVSHFGNWFNTIAIFVLILNHTGSEALLGVLFSVRMLFFGALQPFIGLLADRMSRRNIMVVSNVLGSICVLGFLTIDGPEDMIFLLTLNALLMILHGAYMTSERAALPNIVEDEHLATANALEAASWSTTLALGAAIGGFVVQLWGTDVAFILDAITFLLSALLVLSVKIPQNYSEEMKGSILRTGFSNIANGWKRIRTDSRVLRIVFAKSSWNIAGGGLAGVFLVIMSANLGVGGVAAGIGIFFMARGIGTGVGPILTRKYFTNKEFWPVLSGLMVAISGFFYILVGLAIEQPIWLLFSLILIAHAASGSNWVLSTILTQMWIEDEVRGRVFSADMVFLCISFALSTSIAGYLLEYGYLNLQDGILYFASFMVLSGLFFANWNRSTNINAENISENLKA